MKIKNTKWNPGNKPTVFKPSSLFIKEAVEEFLSTGGSITKFNTENGYYSSMPNKSPLLDVEDYFAEKNRPGKERDN